MARTRGRNSSSNDDVGVKDEEQSLSAITGRSLPRDTLLADFVHDAGSECESFVVIQLSLSSNAIKRPKTLAEHLFHDVRVSAAGSCSADPNLPHETLVKRERCFHLCHTDTLA